MVEGAKVAVREELDAGEDSLIKSIMLFIFHPGRPEAGGVNQRIKAQQQEIRADDE